MNLEFVYKILDEKEWKEAKKNGVYSGTTKDIEDGYIHFSEQQQIQETLKLFYPNQENLVLLKVHTLKLEHLLWEQASNGDMYPHLYSPLDTSTVVDEYELPLNEDGRHELPEILKKYQFSRPR